MKKVIANVKNCSTLYMRALDEILPREEFISVADDQCPVPNPVVTPSAAIVRCTRIRRLIMSALFEIIREIEARKLWIAR